MKEAYLLSGIHVSGVSPLTADLARPLALTRRQEIGDLWSGPAR